MGLKGAWQLTQYWLVSSFTAPHFVQYLLIKFLLRKFVKSEASQNESEVLGLQRSEILALNEPLHKPKA